MPTEAKHPPRLLLCLGPCYGEFYLPLTNAESQRCPNDADHPVAVYMYEGTIRPLTDAEPARCGRIMIGSGEDSWDPTCDLPSGHSGSCKAYTATDQHRL